MRVTHKRLLSVLLALCMVISMASMLSVPVYAAYTEGDIPDTTGTGTKEDPVVCNTFDGFKAAMEHSGISHVKLTGIPGNPAVPDAEGSELQSAITQDGSKTLIIEGETNIYAPLSGRIDSLIAVTNTLNVMGNGRLTFHGGLSNAKNCILRAFSANSHIIVGGTGNKPILIGEPNGNTYGRAITANQGEVTINDGKFEAHGYAHDVYALELGDNVQAEILGGEFYAVNTSTERDKYGLSIYSTTANVTIKGGRFTSGIKVHSSKKISDYLPAGYELRAISGDALIDGNTTAITSGCYVKSEKEINKAVINVTEPVAGADRQDPTVPADSNTSIHNKGWTKLVDGTPQGFSGEFQAGETYRLEVVIVPDTTNGYSFTNNATATINGVTAKTVSSDTTRIQCYRDFKISGTSIQDVAIIVEEPAVGAKPAEPETTTSNTTVYTYEWSHGDDPFQLGQPRTLTVVVHPTDGAFFSDAVAPTINGKPAAIHMKGDDHVNFSYKFDMAATEINITVEEPVAGAIPATPVTTTPNTKVLLYEWSQGDAPFQSGQPRTLTVVVHPTDGTTFKSIIVPKINGELATIHMKGDDHVNFSYEFTVSAPDPVIGHIDVSFTPPAAGGAIEKEVSSYTAAPNCKVTKVEWIPTDDGDWNTFTGGKKYRCTITVVPNEGFSFRPSGPNTTAKFNGIDATVTSIGENKAIYLYDYVIATPDTVIDHIDVSFTPPAAGGTIEKEVSSYTAAPNCEVTEVQWIPTDSGDWNTFTGGKKYRCTITVVPNEGFSFRPSGPNTTAKFNGIDATDVSIGKNKAIYLYDYVISELGHTHNWSTTWQNNGTHHWRECIADGCGITANSEKNEYGEHKFGDWIITKPATENEDGSRESTCSDCSYKATETIPALSHTHTLTNHPAKAATQSAAGNTEYWSCTCGKYFSDAAGTTEITLASTVIPKLSGGSGSGSGGGSTTTTPPAVSTAPDWLEQGKASQSTAEAKAGGHSYALTRANGQYGVRAAAWAAFSGYQYWHDTMDGNAVQVRVYVKNPTAITTDLLVSGYVKGAEAERTKTIFEKFFVNKVRTIHLDQTGAWGQSVELAARVDLTGMDITKLMFYSYDKATNTYRRIEKPAYWVDKNGYLHFTTPYAGDIVISEGALALIENGGAK